MESQASFVQLPEAAVGSLTASACAGCPSLTLQIAAGSTYLIGGRPVAFAEVRKALLADRQLQLLVTYFPANRQLSRIIVTGKAGR